MSRNKDTIFWIIVVIVFLGLFYLQALTNSKTDIIAPGSWCSGKFCD